MNVGQIIVAVLVVGFFSYEIYALVRDIVRKKKAKELLKNEESKTSRV
jgi:hypothetical protein